MNRKTESKEVECLLFIQQLLHIWTIDVKHCIVLLLNYSVFVKIDVCSNTILRRINF